ncbi:MobF family relaxase [Kribbella solani]|uniref:MobF family relaxase n=1 Tax=Kribbella solani TaxID=236067 RepID=UPI0029A54B56|nr:MobF family relaxase [Kribbella solani]MDX2971102.1 MobF family relaxase [Kribbella solani]
MEPRLRSASSYRPAAGGGYRRYRDGRDEGWGCLVLSVRSGHSASYLTGSVATGRENYYTGAVAAGEPPGRWFGKGAEALGLSGEVDNQDMTALYERFIDPRDEAFRDPARWDEAETLGHTGRNYKSEEQVYADALAKEPGASPERRAELRALAGKAVRKNVSFHDATFSPQKSVTVLHTAFEAQEVQARTEAERARGALEAALADAERTGAPLDREAVHHYRGAVHRAEREAVQWGKHRQAVEDAIWAGNVAALNYLQDKAGYTRVGRFGGVTGRWADAHGWTIASFFQHDSREHDPQLHIHNAILNRVQGPDGKWRTIDGQALHRWKPAAGAVGERVMEQHLIKALGVQFKTRPDGKAREIVGIDQAAMDLFSSRRKAITKKTAPMVAAFEAKMGRKPNNLEMAYIQQEASLATRKAKSHVGETVEQRLERWDRQLRAEVRGGLGKVARDVLALRQRQWLPGRINQAKVLETALAEVQSKHATWRAADLTRAISDALPDNLGNMKPAKIAQLLDRLTERGLKLAQQVDADRPGHSAGELSDLPDELRRGDGSSAYSAPGVTRYVTPDHVKAERRLAASGYARGAAAMSPLCVQAFVDRMTGDGLQLGADQGAAVRGVLTSGAKVETLVGPAGTGKSRVVGALAKAWEDPALWGGQQRRLVGLAASQVATEVLAADGVTAKNITRWLTTQQRLADGSAATEDQAWSLRDGDLVVVDESAMANTTDLAQIQTYCDDAGAKLLLVGDHRQLAAVGAGGGMELVTANALHHELSETRRFTAGWEGPASLRLREGDESVLGEYHKQGRILDGGHLEAAQRSAADAWLADHLTGRHALLIVDTNTQAAELSAQLRARLVGYGQVDDERTAWLNATGNRVGAGDLIQTRRNAWSLNGYRGNKRAAFNRDEFKVLKVLDDGGLQVAPLIRGTRQPVPDETMILPAPYVRDWVSLAYAATVHSSQGLTVDASHLVATQNTSVYALYVAMTRGRVANTAHVVTQALAAEAEYGETNDAAKRSALSVLRGAFDLDDPQLSALQTAAEDAAEADRLRTPAELLADGIALATAGRTARWLDELTDAGVLTPDQRTKLAVEDGAGTLQALLRRAELAGHDPRQVLTDAIQQRSLDDARKLSYVIQDRIKNTTGALDPLGDSFADRLPQIEDPKWSAYLSSLAVEADARAAQLGEQVAAERPQWAIESFDEPPTEPGRARDEWIQKAGTVAAHREVMAHEATDDALGKAPKPGQVEQYASWRAAWRALGKPEADRAEAEMSNGQLRVRVRAYEREEAWAPPYVAEELAGTRQAAERERRTAALRAAEADSRDDDAMREQLLAEAEQAKALAQALDARAAELQLADDARAVWWAHTAETRANAERAEAELEERGIDNSDDGPTPEEWLDTADADQSAADEFDVVDEHDLIEVAEARARDFATAQPGDEFIEAELVDDQLPSRSAEPELADDEYFDAEIVADGNTSEAVAEADKTEPVEDRAAQEDLAPADIREVAADEEQVAESDVPRVPSADETAEAVRRAQRALIEIQHRREAEERHAAAADDAEARAEELARWHADDSHTDHVATARTSTTEQASDDHGPVLELGSYDD